MLARKVESKIFVMPTRRTTSNTSRENIVPSSNPSQPTMLTPQQIDETRAKGLCFNCDIKYSMGHKCGEKILLCIDCEEEEEKEHEPSQAKEIQEITPTISCHALDGIHTPQILKIEGYIKNKM